MASSADNRGDDRPVLNIVGEGVALGPLRRDLLPAYHRWNNDFVTTRTLVQLGPTTLEQEEAEYRTLLSGEQGAFFTIYERATWRVIGMTYLADIDHRHRTAEFGIVIGEADARGKGYGTEITRIVVDYAFTALGLHNVMLTVYEYNHAGRRVYEKAGFREFGRRRQAHFMGGRLWDIIYMECLAPDALTTPLRQIFIPDELYP